MLLAEQFPQRVRAAGQLGHALAGPSLDLDGFEGVAQVLDVLAPLVQRPAAGSAMADLRSLGTSTAAATGAVDVLDARRNETVRWAVWQLPLRHARAQGAELPRNLLAGDGVPERLR